MKVCKQCGRTLPDEFFRPYVARGRGIYSTTQGRHTICKDCESMSNRAAAALKKNDIVAIAKLTKYYETLQSRGYAPVTAPAKKLLGISTTQTKAASLDDAIQAMLGNTGTNECVDKAQEHYKRIKERTYESAEEADRVHRTLEDSLRAAGLYEEATELLDEWYFE